MEEVLTKSHTLLTFSLGKEVYAFDISFVKEIIEFKKLSIVPESPPHMIGIVNLKGTILSVIDTSFKLGFDFITVDEKSRIIVLELQGVNGSVSLGALVDRATDVISVEGHEIAPPPNTGDHKAAIWMEGIINHDDKFITLLDAQHLFSKKEIETFTNSLT